MRRVLAVAMVAAALLLVPPSSALARAGKGFLFHDGTTVRTVVVPARVPHGGTDPFFMVANGAAGQLGIAGVAPGDPRYSGGDWAVHLVTFNVTPYLLTSDEAVAAAEAAGDVTVTRIPEADFRCPIQP